MPSNTIPPPIVAPWQQIAWVILTAAIFVTWRAYFARRQADEFSLVERSLAAIFATVAQILVTTFILGWLNLLYWWPLGIVNLVFTAGLAFQVSRMKYGRGIFAEAVQVKTAMVKLASSSGAVAVAGIVSILVIIWVVYLGWLLPPWDYDIWAYHLSWVGFAHQEGNLGPFPMPYPFIDCYPMNTQMLFLWFVIGTGTDQLASLVQTPFAIVTALACYMIARHVGANRTDAALTGLLVFSIPTIIQQMWMAKVDIAVTAGVLTSLAFLSRKRFTPGSLLIAGLASGFFIGSKGTGIILAIGLLFFFIVRLLLMSREELEVSTGSKVKRIVSGLLIVCIPAFLLGSFFYLRNWVLHGNPAGIFGVKLGSMVLFEGIDLKALLFWRETWVPPALYHAVEEGNEWPIVLDGFFDPQTGFWQGNYIGGWGSPWTIFMLPAIPIAYLIALMRKKWLLPLILLACLIPYFISSSVNHVWTRYYLPVIGVGTTSFAYMLHVLDKTWVHRAIRIFAVACMIATVFVSSQHMLIDPADIAAARNVPLSQRDMFVPFESWGDKAFADALRSVQEPGTTLAFSGIPPDKKIRAMWNLNYSNRTVWVQYDSDGEAWEMRLRSEGADWVLVNGDTEEMGWALTHADTFERVYVGRLGGIYRLSEGNEDVEE